MYPRVRLLILMQTFFFFFSNGTASINFIQAIFEFAKIKIAYNNSRITFSLLI